MKKIAILSAVNIKHMSLISLYLDILKTHDVQVDLIYMDKYGEEEFFECDNIYRYVRVINPKWNSIFKALCYGSFVPYAIKVLEKNKYDFVIVWNDVAILLFSYYLSIFKKGLYCLNIRDYNGENNRIVFHIFSKAIKNACFTTISSFGFKSFLPSDYSYVPLYSYNIKLLNDLQKRIGKIPVGTPIRISFIGNVRFFDQNKKLVDAFKNDDRFVLCFHGTNAELIQQYADEIGAYNVECSGPFPVLKTKDYLEKADIINNVFGNNSIGVKTLTSIRLFHAAHLNIPILVSDNTYMADVVRKYQIGYIIDAINEDLPDSLYKWYQSFDNEELKQGCLELLEEANKANADFESFFSNLINSL